MVPTVEACIPEGSVTHAEQTQILNRSGTDYAEDKCSTYVKTKHCKSPAIDGLIEGSRNVIVNVDIRRPLPRKRNERRCYFLTINTTRQRFIWILELMRRDETVAHTLQYIVWLD